MELFQILLIIAAENKVLDLPEFLHWITTRFTNFSSAESLKRFIKNPNQ
jgi:hypothetical protein